MSKTECKVWEQEPDSYSEKRSGYHLVVWRNPHMKTLNGYVGVRINHSLYGLSYDSRKLQNICVHGGLTFEGKRGGSVFQNRYWYFGFDTAHYMDFIPAIAEQLSDISLNLNEEYRDFDYVLNEVRNLFEQLKKEGRTVERVNHKGLYKRMKKEKRNFKLTV